MRAGEHEVLKWGQFPKDMHQMGKALHHLVAQWCIDCMHADCAGGYNEEFRGKMRSVLYNLKDEKNQDFRGKVLRSEVTPTRICHMESHDMASEVLLYCLACTLQQPTRSCRLEHHHLPLAYSCATSFAAHKVQQRGISDPMQ